MKNGSANIALQKQAITRTLERLNSSLLEAKNAFYSVVTLQEMESILESEIREWCNWTESNTTEDKEHNEEIQVTASGFIADFQSILVKVRKHKAPLIDEALKIEAVYLREKKIPSLKIKQ